MPGVRRVLVLVAVLATAWLTAPSVAAAAGTVTVQMTGAGTVALQVAAGTPAQTASCPEHPDLSKPDTGPAYQACAVSFAQTCAATGTATCLVRVSATPKVPGPPDLDQGEVGGWRALAWTSGPCAGKTGACAFTVGTCTAGPTCTYTDVELTAAFDDVRDPRAVVYTGPPALSTDPNGVASFLLGSNEYKQHETATLTCLLDGVKVDACQRRPQITVLTGVADGDHALKVQATDPSGRTGPTTTYEWTQ